MADSAAVVRFVLTLCLLLSGPAGAQEAAGSPIRGDSPDAARSAEERVPGMKSGTTAFLWSFLGTFVPATAGGLSLYRGGASDSNVPGIVLAGGVILGPSLGHFYAARPGRALAGIGIRTLASVGIAAALMEIAAEGNETNFATLGAFGVIVGGASLAWDIIKAPHSARVHNEQARRTRMGIGITPSLGLELRAEVSF